MKQIVMFVMNSVLFEARVWRQAESLAKDGWRVQLVGMKDARLDVNETHTPGGVPVRLLDIREIDETALKMVKRRADIPVESRMREFLQRRAEGIGSVLMSYKPDVVHCHDLLPLVLAEAGVPALVKIAYDAHEVYDNLAAMPEADAKKIDSVERKVAQRVSLFSTVNDTIAAHYAKKGFPPAVILKNAVHLQSDVLRKPTAKDYLNIIGQIPNYNAQKIALYHGGFQRGRHLEILTRVGKYLPDDWLVVLMGWGNPVFEPFLKKSAGPRTVFLPPAPYPQLARYACAATVGLIPYGDTCANHAFCLPTKLWEYPMAGVPVLANRLAEVQPLVHDNGIGYFFTNPMTPESVAKDILAHDWTDYALRERCLDFAEWDSWEVYGARLVRAYRKTFGEPRS